MLTEGIVRVAAFLGLPDIDGRPGDSNMQHPATGDVVGHGASLTMQTTIAGGGTIRPDKENGQQGPASGNSRGGAQRNPSLKTKTPLDGTPYPRDPGSAPISGTTSDGGYVYVRDASGTVYVLPDGPHLHPKVLGGALPASYAGDLTIAKGTVVDLTNLSGTFRFRSRAGLLDVAKQLESQGLTIQPGAVRFFPADGSRPVTLR